MDRGLMDTMQRVLLFLILAASMQPAETAETAIRRVFDLQVQAWNRGDLKTFSDFYSDDALFVGKTPIREG